MLSAANVSPDEGIDTTAETRIDVLVFTHRPLSAYALAAHGIKA